MPVSAITRNTHPDPGQLAAWRELWRRLLSSRQQENYDTRDVA